MPPVNLTTPIKWRSTFWVKGLRRKLESSNFQIFIKLILRGQISVNLASRIESLTKYYDVSLLISHHTYLRLPNSDIYAIRTIDRVKVKGKSETVSIFEVFDADPPEIREGKLATATVFEQALLLYNQDNYVDAEQMFRDCLFINPLDKVAQIYLERCQLQLLYKVKV
ncbi:hypothetical protein H6G03_19885 [Planktothrix sp. FACHB-1375]|uniref:Uncharacterized protein n=1 Tax=Aerosakkonema funiforme FACHB-1375 TaxID=2949571 RepID=A0A926ZI41_9CYAN|nr:hypothetical protein [Aerosakkonema funiforme FACHB-1375]